MPWLWLWIVSSLRSMGNREEVRDFLQTRRAMLTPDQVGLPDFGGHRRVPGLRREEVAMLVGISLDYYIRIERGDLTGVSVTVLEALARTLKLSYEERCHLMTLARDADDGPVPETAGSA